MRAAAERYKLAPALLAGLVDHESNWNPRAYRFEPFKPGTNADDDASRGLTQVLLRTAREIGYGGTAEGMFDPATSLDLGAHYLDTQIRRAGGSLAGGLSAYNGGYRPNDGFGQPSPREYDVVLARNAQSVPTLTRHVRVGQYANQPYVDSVMLRARAFAQSLEWNSAAGTPASGPASIAELVSPLPRPAPAPVPFTLAGAGAPSGKAVAVAAAGAIAAWLLWKAFS